MLTFSSYLVHGRGWPLLPDHELEPTIVITSCGHSEWLMGGNRECQMFWTSLIMKKLAVKMLCVKQCPCRAPISLSWQQGMGCWDESIHLGFSASLSLHPQKSCMAQSAISAVNVVAGHTWDLGFASGMSRSREGTEFLLKLINVSDICEAKGGSQRTPMCFHSGKGENPPFVSVQLYHWAKRND